MRKSTENDLSISGEACNKLRKQVQTAALEKESTVKQAIAEAEEIARLSDQEWIEELEAKDKQLVEKEKELALYKPYKELFDIVRPILLSLLVREMSRSVSKTDSKILAKGWANDISTVCTHGHICISFLILTTSTELPRTIILLTSTARAFLL